MFRKHYIRFFISSTFIDMERERNRLADIFNRLKEEYQEKGWQIEYVDLRWGISEKAGRDNRTMNICKAELRRCQYLSPRPNFIVLLGERYGWIPLPETVHYILGKELDKVTKTFGDHYLRDFNDLSKWYSPIHNLKERIVDEGPWILQPFKDVDLEKEDKELLYELFEELYIARKQAGFEDDTTGFFSSATEQEIYCGALRVRNVVYRHIFFQRYCFYFRVTNTR